MFIIIIILCMYVLKSLFVLNLIQVFTHNFSFLFN